jgi:Flp pilus assembly protein TadD
VLPGDALVMAGREDEPAPRRVARRTPRTGDPDAFFWRAYKSYWAGNYKDALENLEDAVALRGQDPRYWSYKALAERKMGYDRDAEASAQQARILRQQNQRGSADLGTVLERVQGPDREFLNRVAEASRP